jgi:hypothetical protein
MVPSMPNDAKRYNDFVNIVASAVATFLIAPPDFMCPL